MHMPWQSMTSLAITSESNVDGSVTATGLDAYSDCMTSYYIDGWCNYLLPKYYYLSLHIAQYVSL